MWYQIQGTWFNFAQYAKVAYYRHEADNETSFVLKIQLSGGACETYYLTEQEYIAFCRWWSDKTQPVIT